MFVLICNSGDGDMLWSEFVGMYETHDEAHKVMVDRIEAHRKKRVEDWGEEAADECTTIKLLDDEGHFVEGDVFDWSWYDKYLIFDTEDDGKTFNWTFNC